MTTAALKEKIKEMEKRLTFIERRVLASKPRATFSEAIKPVRGMWKNKPRTAKDLARVRRKIWA
ncbi:MAG: hypothetical protein AAB386_01210 [Patescibacteria group bacterium]